jgi:hypothetical protein
MRNARINIAYIFKHFITTVFLMEAAAQSTPELANLSTNPGYHYMFYEDGNFFHRTKYLNLMAKQVTTPVIAVHDIDVIMNPASYVLARDKLYKEGFAVWYPYSSPPGVCYINSAYLDRFEATLDWQTIVELRNRSCLRRGPVGNGYTCWFQTAIYLWGKGENEEFLSYAPEDRERLYRFYTLGLRTMPCNTHWGISPRYTGVDSILHMDHARGKDSSNGNPYWQHNMKIMLRLVAMNKAQLMAYYKIEGPPPYLPIPPPVRTAEPNPELCSGVATGDDLRSEDRNSGIPPERNDIIVDKNDASSKL